ncbi:MAG: hypothetical protein ISS93_00265 [Candidatus Aenigmarchaeota archaeon]|nr:hypothetical protein [Candidatus Aenigmarchaeota archaeon]
MVVRKRQMSGQFYSIIAVLIAIPVLLFVTGTLVSIQDTETGVREKLVADQLHLIEKSVEDDFHKGFEISAKRALLALTDFAVTDGRFITIENHNKSAGELYTELLYNGTLFGEESYLMINNTLYDWKSKIINATGGFEVDFNFTNIVATYDDIYFGGTYGLNITVKNRFGTSRIEKIDERKEFSFSVLGFEDPLFAVETSGLVRRQYELYPYSFYAQQLPGSLATCNAIGNVSFDADDPDKAQKILVVDDITGHSGWECVVGNTGTPAQSCYVTGVPLPVTLINQTIQSLGDYPTLYVDNNTNSVWSLPIRRGLEDGHYFGGDAGVLLFGPNLLERLQGMYNFSTNPQFITFINAQEFQEAGIEITSDRTHVCWAYFLPLEYQGYEVRGMPEWFRIDTSSAAAFGLSQLMED